MVKDLAPIALFVYNRPALTLQTLQHLSLNAEAERSLLYVFCDGPKATADASQLDAIQEVRKIVREKQWCGEVEIIESDHNKGLANSIIAGVTRLTNDYGRVIVVEDDLSLSPYFLQYMNDALELYAAEDKVLAVHGYLYPTVSLAEDSSVHTFFVRDPGCWGWATWKRSWELFEPNSRKLYDLIQLKGLKHEFTFWGGYPYIKMLKNQMRGEIDSWAVRWRAVAYLHDKLTLYPDVSLVSHEGNVPDATHHYTGDEDPYGVELADKPVQVTKIPLVNSGDIERRFGKFLRKNSGLDIYSKIKKRVKGLFKADTAKGTITKKDVERP